MHEFLVKTTTEVAEDGTAYTYSYSILVDDVDTGSFFCESYGIKISADGDKEIAAVSHVTTDLSRIQVLAELLSKHAVSPCTLSDVLADWL